MMYRLFLSIVCISCLSASRARADVFYLTSGGRVEGELLNPDESPRKTYLVQIPDGGKLKLANTQIERVVVKSEAEKSYETFVATLPDTVDAHWDTAQRCEKAGLAAQRDFHLEQVLRLDPIHEQARHALGYSRVEGKWVRPDEVMRQKGYVRYGNAWRLPQEIELDAAAEAQEKQTVEWRKKLKMWREWLVKNRERAVDGRNEITRIRDPLAVAALVEALTRDKELQPIRLLYIEPLAEIGGPEALATFVRLVLEDRDAEVRQRCLDRLAKSGSKSAVRQFIKALKHDDNIVVQRAAVALERMNDAEATLPLIEALITEHKQIVGGNSLNPTFSGDGGAGLSMGGGPKVVKKKVQNEAVRRALSTIHPGVNFGFDQPRWRAWYIDQNKPKTSVSLRRDF